MALNGSGSYSPPAADFPAVPNTLIESTKFNNIINDIATALSTAVYKDGQQTVTANIPMGGFRFTGLGAGAANGQSLRYEQLFSTSAVALLGALDMVKGADIASAGTLNLTTATGNGVHITGTTTITAVTLGSGMWRIVVFDGALTLTHHATNNNLPGGANITTAAGDRALYWADGTTVYCAVYMKANGKPIAGASGAITSSDFTMTTARLLGRTTASTGAIEEISVGTDFALSSGALSLNPASGTFTPAITFATPGNLSVSYTTQHGSYYKIGSLVFVRVNIITSAFTHTTASGNLQITGFPFAAETNVSGLSRLALDGWQGITSAGYTQMSIRLESNSTTAAGVKNGSGQTTSTITAGDMPTGGTVVLQCSGVYLAGA